MIFFTDLRRPKAKERIARPIKRAARRINKEQGLDGYPGRDVSAGYS
jgi:hypothetical protein